MDLRALQQDFQSALLDGNRRFEARIRSCSQADAVRRLAVYRQAYRLRLLDVLQTDYPKLAAFLGAAAFEQLARQYLARHPSDNPSLRWFGRHMAGFLSVTSPWSEDTRLAELAAFEWLQSEVFDAADAPATDSTAVSHLPAQAWPRVRLRPHPALRRLDLRWDVPSLWRALERETPEPEMKPGARPRGWLLWRRDLDIHWRSLGADEAWAIDAWRDGASFAELCNGLCAWVSPATVAGHAAALLKGWLNDGLITAVLTE